MRSTLLEIHYFTVMPCPTLQYLPIDTHNCTITATTSSQEMNWDSDWLESLSGPGWEKSDWQGGSGPQPELSAGGGAENTDPVDTHSRTHTLEAA